MIFISYINNDFEEKNLCGRGSFSSWQDTNYFIGSLSKTSFQNCISKEYCSRKNFHKQSEIFKTFQTNLFLEKKRFYMHEWGSCHLPLQVIAGWFRQGNNPLVVHFPCKWIFHCLCLCRCRNVSVIYGAKLQLDEVCHVVFWAL